MQMNGQRRMHDVNSEHAGSQQTPPRLTLSKEDVRDCRKIIRHGSKSFYFASLVLPWEVRDAALALYSFCRISDDLVDGEAATLQTLADLRERLDAVYRKRPYAHVADRALADVVARYDIPQDVVLSMIEGFEWDLVGKRYDTLSDVLDYSARVAGTVGVMMTLIMKRRSARTLARASDLGCAMQLTNIARDVGEDARNGRLYLPREWMEAEGLDADAFLENPVFTPALGRVVERLLDEAIRIYKRALTGLTDLPLSCRPGIRAAGLVYAEIGAAVRQNGFDSVTQRAHTTSQKKMVLLIRALAGAVRSPVCDDAAALAETQYLIESAAKPDVVRIGAVETFLDLLHSQHIRQRSAVAGAATRRNVNA